MDELQTIRKTLWRAKDCNVEGWDKALAALSRLEAIATEIPDTAKLAAQIRDDKIGDNHAGMLIGQYAYRYSEDIRKDRDEWKALAEGYVKAVGGLLGR